MAQTGCQLLREIILQFCLLALHDFRDVVEDKNLLVSVFYLDPSYFDFDCLGDHGHFSQLITRAAGTGLEPVEHGYHDEVALKVCIVSGQGSQTLQPRQTILVFWTT